MERIGKVFKMGVKDIGQCRIVDGFVRSKNIKNIARSIDFLDVVTDKLGDKFNEAIAHYPERDIDKGDCWGLLVEPTEKLTYFTYSFVNQPAEGPKEKTENTEQGQAEGSALNDLDKVLANPDEDDSIEVHPAEQTEIIPVVVEEKEPEVKKEKAKAKKKTEKKDKDDKAPKPPKGGAKVTKKAEKKEKAPKKNKYSEGVKNFIRRQMIALEALMWTFNPVKAEMVYGPCMA